MHPVLVRNDPVWLLIQLESELTLTENVAKVQNRVIHFHLFLLDDVDVVNPSFAIGLIPLRARMHVDSVITEFVRDELLFIDDRQNVLALEPFLNFFVCLAL